MYQITYQRSGSNQCDYEHNLVFNEVVISINREFLSHNIIFIVNICRSIERIIGYKLHSAYLENTNLIIRYDIANCNIPSKTMEQFDGMWNLVNNACLEVFHGVPCIIWDIEITSQREIQAKSFNELEPIDFTI
jgi:hypothetical protein